MCNLRIRTIYPLSLLPNLLLRLLMDSGLKPGRDPSPNNCSDGGLRRQKTWTSPLRHPTNGDNRPLTCTGRLWEEAQMCDLVLHTVANHKEACEA